jgi:hypothetical protein
MKTQLGINLIYIASTGRSGSTILEMILGAHPQIATSGEIQVWPHEILENGVQNCGCGKPIPVCPFWMDMYERAKPLQQAAPQIHFFREKHYAGRTLRWRRLWELYSGQLSEKVITMIETYGKNNHQIFSVFHDLVQERRGARPQWVVDASKDPYRLLWLLQSKLFNIKVLHIIKDPRSFVYSMTKDLLASNSKALQGNLLLRIVAKSLTWMIQNCLISQVTQSYLSPADYLIVHYEEFASRPREILNEIFKLIGYDFEEGSLSHFREITMHTIAGNPGARFQRRKIDLDDAWKILLPYSCQKLIEIITWPVKTRYEY